MSNFSSSICSDFVHFRNLLKEDRRFDDNLKYRLNAIDVNDYMSCANIAVWLNKMHCARRATIKKCVNELEQSGNINDQVLRKELLLLKGELVVEEIVEEQSWSVLKGKCRILADIDRFRTS